MEDAKWIKLIDRLHSADESKRLHAALLLSRASEDAGRTREVLEPLLEGEEPVRSLAAWILARLPGESDRAAA
jgi:hypothetical protein